MFVWILRRYRIAWVCVFVGRGGISAEKCLGVNTAEASSELGGGGQERIRGDM